MNIILQIIFVVSILFFLLLVFHLIRKNSLSLKYSIFWIFVSIVMLIFSIFPNLLNTISKLAGFIIPSNALFSILFLFFTIILLFLTSIVSSQAEKIKAITQANALLEKTVRDIIQKNCLVENKEDEV